MKLFAKLFPWLVFGTALATILMQAIMPKDDNSGMKEITFGELPVVYQGRIKPFDTLARNSLMAISDRQTFVDENDDRQPAIKWLIDVISNADAAGKHKVFRIESLQVQRLLHLKRRKGFRYAYNEFVGRIAALEEQADRVLKTSVAMRDAYDEKLLEFRSKLDLFWRLGQSHEIPMYRDRAGFDRVLKRQQHLMRLPIPHAVPPIGEGEEWQPFMSAALVAPFVEDPNPTVAPFGKMLQARSMGDAVVFNRELAAYQTVLASHGVADPETLRFETFLNNLGPFVLCIYLYLAAGLLVMFSWLGWSKPFMRAAFWMTLLTLGLHTFGIIARIQISGYPPVTNLYGSAIFIGWGCVVIGLILERIFRVSVGLMVSTVTGFLTLLVAHNLPGEGDTMEMMRAVLDTKFWLATHVTTVTLGYTATYLAGFLGILFILRGVFTRTLTKSDETIIGKMIYGVLCFALFLSFVGTVLGGLWADDSWGRFWGWDPKENGALIIVLWNALILHARWGGMVRHRGMAVLSLFGNIVTSWSWFGVNQLNIGLHSYGKVDSITWWLLFFVSSQLLLMAVGLVPRRMWRSALANQPQSAPADVAPSSA